MFAQSEGQHIPFAIRHKMPKRSGKSCFVAVPCCYSDLTESLLQTEAAEVHGTAQLVQQLVYHYWQQPGVLASKCNISAAQKSQTMRKFHTVSMADTRHVLYMY